jgi:basic membrane protein A
MKSLAALIATLTITAACPLSAQAQAPVIIYVSGPLGVNPFLRQGWDGAQKAASELGVQARNFESSDPTQHRQNLEAAAKSGAKVVVSITYEFNDILPEIAAKYPDTKFVHIDSCPAKLSENITCVTFREYEASFLAGAEAALTSGTGKVGAIAALDIPFLHRYTDAFAEGARYAKPDIEIASPLYVGGDRAFSDPARGQQRATSMFSDGVDRVLTAASGSDGGVFNAAGDFPGAMGIGVDINECPSAPGIVLDNVEKRTDVAVYKSVVAAIKGEGVQQTSLGVGEGALTLTGLEASAAGSQCEIVKYPEVIEKLRAIRSDIVAGKIVIKDPMFAN